MSREVPAQAWPERMYPYTTMVLLIFRKSGTRGLSHERETGRLRVLVP